MMLATPTPDRGMISFGRDFLAPLCSPACAKARVKTAPDAFIIIALRHDITA